MKNLVYQSGFSTPEGLKKEAVKKGIGAFRNSQYFTGAEHTSAGKSKTYPQLVLVDSACKNADAIKKAYEAVDTKVETYTAPKPKKVAEPAKTETVKNDTDTAEPAADDLDDETKAALAKKQ